VVLVDSPEHATNKPPIATKNATPIEFLIISFFS
jgi:hypothetical protein